MDGQWEMSLSLCPTFVYLKLLLQTFLFSSLNLSVLKRSCFIFSILLNLAFLNQLNIERLK